MYEISLHFLFFSLPYFSNIFIYFFFSKNRSPESRISTVSCLTWKQNIPRKVGNLKEEKKQKSENHVGSSNSRSSVNKLH